MYLGFADISILKSTYSGKDELKIRQELEREIERDLEEELKEGIYHFAVRLHRLYQQQKERNDAREYGAKRAKEEKMKKAFSEININIKMKGGTKIEIKETKLKAKTQERSKNTSGSQSSRSDYNMMQSMKVIKSKKNIDWVNTLRSSTCNDHHFNVRKKLLVDSIAKRNNTITINSNPTTKRQHIRGTLSLDNVESLGWKY